MDGVTRGNAARAEESSSAAAELTSQAGLMQETVEYLRSLVAAGGGRGGRGDRPTASPLPRFDAAGGATIRKLPPSSAQAAPVRPSLPAASTVHIPMPGDGGLPHDDEDRNFKNF